MPTTSQKADLLFKKLLHVGSSDVGSWQYYNELLNGSQAILPSQVWAEESSIPVPAPSVSTSVVQVIQDLVLLPMAGATSSFYHPLLKDTIPFTFGGDNSYAPILKKADNTPIVLGQGDWVLDTDVGQLTFYAGLPSGVSPLLPPKISCWRYIGKKGTVSGTNVVEFISGQIDSPSVDNQYYLINSNPAPINIQSLNIALWHGHGSASIIVDSTPVPGLTNVPLTGIDTLTTASAIGGYLVSQGSVVILQLSNMTVDAGRTRFTVSYTRGLS